MATTSLQAHADLLLARSRHWSRGHRQVDGLQFVLFSGSTGQTYMTTETGCTCKGAFYRGNCAHQTAVRAEAERAREQATRKPLKRYEAVFGADDLEDSF